MAAPRKPWEKPGVNFHNLPNRTSIGVPPNSYLPGSRNMYGGGGQPGGIVGGSGVARPPVPQRPTSYGYGYSPYSNGYGYSPYGSMFGGSPYSSMYGGGGYGYGRYGLGGYSSMAGYSAMGGGGVDNGFIQMAEESSRPAFQSIEAIVHAVGSVSMMLESTYNALYRAVLGVAHHFSRMKSQFAQIFSLFAVVRSLRWLYRKALYMLGVTKENPTAEEIWSKVSGVVGEASSNSPDGIEAQSKSNWPIVMFFAIVFGAPWVIWKLLVSVTGINTKIASWMTEEQGNHYKAVALYDFVGESERELSFTAGDAIRLAPKTLQPRISGWLLATIDGKKSGLVPVNYVALAKRANAAGTGPNLQGQTQTTTQQGVHAGELGNAKITPHQPLPQQFAQGMQTGQQEIARNVYKPQTMFPLQTPNGMQTELLVPPSMPQQLAPMLEQIRQQLQELKQATSGSFSQLQSGLPNGNLEKVPENQLQEVSEESVETTKSEEHNTLPCELSSEPANITQEPLVSGTDNQSPEKGEPSDAEGN